MLRREAISERASQLTWDGSSPKDLRRFILTSHFSSLRRSKVKPDAMDKAALGQLMRFRDKGSGYAQIQKNATANAGLRADGFARIHLCVPETSHGDFRVKGKESLVHE
jgi:hypothetical protein